jgi:hypothetical protein
MNQKTFLRKGTLVLFLILLSSFFIVVVSAEEFGYDNPYLPRLSQELLPYGEMYVSEDNGSVVSFASQDAYVLFTENQTEGLTKGLTFSDGNLTIDIAGIYDVKWHSSIRGQTGSTHGIIVGINAVKQDKCYAQRKLGSADVGSISDGCYLDLNVGDNVSMLVADEDVTLNDLIIVTSNFRLNKIED